MPKVSTCTGKTNKLKLICLILQQFEMFVRGNMPKSLRWVHGKLLLRFNTIAYIVDPFCYLILLLYCRCRCFILVLHLTIFRKFIRISEMIQVTHCMNRQWTKTKQGSKNMKHKVAHSVIIADCISWAKNVSKSRFYSTELSHLYLFSSVSWATSWANSKEKIHWRYMKSPCQVQTVMMLQIIMWTHNRIEGKRFKHYTFWWWTL